MVYTWWLGKISNVITKNHVLQAHVNFSTAAQKNGFNTEDVLAKSNGAIRIRFRQMLCLLQIGLHSCPQKGIRIRNYSRWLWWGWKWGITNKSKIRKKSLLEGLLKFYSNEFLNKMIDDIYIRKKLLTLKQRVQLYMDWKTT